MYLHPSRLTWCSLEDACSKRMNFGSIYTEPSYIEFETPFLKDSIYNPYDMR